MVRKYGKPVKKTTAELLFAELPKSPLKKPETVATTTERIKISTKAGTKENPICVDEIEQRLKDIVIADSEAETESEKEVEKEDVDSPPSSLRKGGEAIITPPTPIEPESPKTKPISHPVSPLPSTPNKGGPRDELEEDYQGDEYSYGDESLRILTWDDVCPPGDTIQKIAEASYAEVYRITNDRGTSIIKVIRLPSPIKPQTKAQQKSGLVDEEPHPEESLTGELQISEWLADVPGFVIYKERYVVQGKAPKALLETHQLFHRRMKRQDPDRLQFYPSPSRYLDETKFLVVELGDAGTALEDFALDDVDQVWDIFLHTAIALARAEELVQFEHRDLHEGNLCIRKARPPKPRPILNNSETPQQDHCRFGYSGLEITILDYGLSRASDPYTDEQTEPPTIFADLETDLALFTSTHAAQCTIYRQMRSYLLSGQSRGGRKDPFLNPALHQTPYDLDMTTLKPISWKNHHPYTNVLWLSYIYTFLTEHFVNYAVYPSGKVAALAARKEREEMIGGFKRETREMWMHLDPMAPRKILAFGCAVDVVRFAVEAGWVRQEQLVEDGLGGEGEGRSMLSFVDDGFEREGGDGEGEEEGEAQLRRSPRRKTTVSS
ncbi:haspin protein kinase [Naviculisporaceae sp. PSN 640]